MMCAADVASLFSRVDKRGLVTSSSSGLGQHFAMRLARAGAQVVVGARRVGI